MTFEPDQSEVTVIVPIIDDELVEGNETFRGVVSLSSFSTEGVRLGTRNVTTITIIDDDCECVVQLAC